ncbi:PHD finger protein ALFIN-LIKE 4-like [Spodoptera litura]|uniref:PHD finger protein ALFIN-LIKE 4-like n=1 Tax=Spodoptera litura TaxID=69820 RepID=A0A9J7E280_SPOLT|nr:PHD finger protein ALFIN-LIKE 4-like [Spodoptera litura]
MARLKLLPEAIIINKEKQRVKKRKVEKKEKRSSKQPRDRVKKKVLQESSEDDDDEDETICLGCGSSYSEDISGVDWVECICCKGWSHITCIKGDAVAYVCTNCNSDSDYDN